MQLDVSHRMKGTRKLQEGGEMGMRVKQVGYMPQAQNVRFFQWTLKLNASLREVSCLLSPNSDQIDGREVTLMSLLCNTGKP